MTTIHKKISGRPIFARRIACLALTAVMLAKPEGVFAFSTGGTRSNQARMHFSCATGTLQHVSLLGDRNTKGRRRRNGIHTLAANSNLGSDDGDAFGAVGLYKKFADHALEALLGTGWLQEDTSVPLDLSKNQAPAKGSKIESVVKISTKALIPSTDDKPLVRYARITLLETVPVSMSADGTVVSPSGIQVLNFVVLPNADTTLPVLGIDLVTLPGSKNLLLLDAQPMTHPNPHESHWEGWFDEHVKNSEESGNDEEPLKYAWGGDFPEPVQKYVSKYALWTRLQNLSENDEEKGTAPAADAIQGDIFVAFRAHLDAYLNLLGQYESNIAAVEGDNHQPSYLDYRRNNDPAKPMLNALYGPEWTQTLLDNVLFPQD